ncbi:MAG: hypothetical protein EOR69_27020 [Mesorhizobium sp.]|nr:MAG: hypothetical protein EOR69_27020 [Mesorhizobium sp.]RWL95449.1 MAG: hypothetical protein EOR70_23135 [Mesorhizobium sp.]
MSLECSSVCVVNGQGKIEREAKVASEPDALIAWFAALEVPCNTSLNFDGTGFHQSRNLSQFQGLDLTK